MADPKERLDQMLVRRGLVDSRALAQRMIMAGQVRLEGQLVLQPSTRVAPDAAVEMISAPRFVSRGGEKLEAALQQFRLQPAGWVCADVGASTGGFTDCLLQHGAARVYAIDVGHGQLHWRLRNDPRVVLMERKNARTLKELPEPIRLATVDVSFISLRLILPSVEGWLVAGGEVVALVKPQFEAGRSQVGKGGVVKDPGTHQQVLFEILEAAIVAGLAPQGLIRSPLVGPKGNIEFLAWLRKGGDPANLERLVSGTS
jgi:23S rRNA (cytidine1920-2'-O)/16S rRNA (cytidine1409-2'-O)-methyltransferase